MQKWTPNEQNGSQMPPKCSPNPPLEASKWARKAQHGSRGTKMVSMSVQELPKMAPRDPRWPQDGPKIAQDDSKGGKLGPNMRYNVV